MKDVIILGGSGYVGKNLIKLNKSKTKRHEWSFYARRETTGATRYKEPKDIPYCNVIIDFSQRSKINTTVSESNIKKEEQRILDCLEKCHCYIFISTANINLEKTNKSPGSIYSNYKRHFEEYLNTINQDGKIICTVRVPIVFGDRPKEGTVIEKILKVVKGEKAIFRDMSSKITAVHIEELKSKLEDIVDMLKSDKKKHKKILISERYIYRIKDIIQETKVKKEELDSDNLTVNGNSFENRRLIQKDDCYHLRLEEKKFYAKIRELAKSEWFT